MRQEANTKMEKMERVEEVWTRDKKPEPPAEKVRESKKPGKVSYRCGDLI